jgi:hypothetical protein
MPRKSIKVVVLVAVFSVGGSAAADATSRYKRSVYSTRVVRGVTQVQAKNRGAWGARWITVAPKGYVVVQEVACGVGPVFVIRSRTGSYSLKALNWKNGSRLWSKHTARVRPSVLSAGSYGVRFRVGKKYYSTHHGRVSGPFRR